MSHDNQDEEMTNVAEIGIEAEAFFNSRLGRSLLDRADNERVFLLDELIKADPEDAKLQREIRLKLTGIDLSLQWLTEAINSGRLAHDQLRRQDSEQIGH